MDGGWKQEGGVVTAGSDPMERYLAPCVLCLMFFLVRLTATSCLQIEFRPEGQWKEEN